MFRGNRSYDGMKAWMKKLLKDLTLGSAETVSMPEPQQDVQYLQQQYQQNLQQAKQDNMMTSDMVT